MTIREDTTATGKDLGAVRAAQSEAAQERRRSGLWGTGRAILPFAVLIGIWWAIWFFFRPSEVILQPPQKVVGALIEIITEGTFSAYVSISLGRLAIGVAVGVLIGVPLGWLLGLDRDISDAAEPVLRFFNAVSGIAWLPLMISWFGFTERTITSVIVYTMLFPVVFNSMIGVRTIPPRFRDAARTLGAGWYRIIRDVYMPGSFPSVMTGLRLGIGYGWRALIAGEFVVGGGGIGFMLFQGRTAGAIDRVMLGMILLGVLWLIIDRLILRPIEEYTVNRWGMVRS
jgi:NitT/TauT family transport system permease protein/taurine transport system permease protein